MDAHDKLIIQINKINENNFIFGYEKDENGEDLTILSYALSGTKEDITSGKRIYKFIML